MQFAMHHVTIYCHVHPPMQWNAYHLMLHLSRKVLCVRFSPKCQIDFFHWLTRKPTAQRIHAFDFHLDCEASWMSLWQMKSGTSRDIISHAGRITVPCGGSGGCGGAGASAGTRSWFYRMLVTKLLFGVFSLQKPITGHCVQVHILTHENILLST